MQVPGSTVHALGPWCWVQARPGPQYMRAPGPRSITAPRAHLICGAPGPPARHRPLAPGGRQRSARRAGAARSAGADSGSRGRLGEGLAPPGLGAAGSLSGGFPSVPCVPVLGPGGQDDHPTPRPAVPRIAFLRKVSAVPSAGPTGGARGPPRGSAGGDVGRAGGGPRGVGGVPCSLSNRSISASTPLHGPY